MDIKNVPSTSGVYIIKCIPNKKIYVGSCCDLHAKLKLYKNDLEYKKHRVEGLNQDIKKYGIDNICLDILCTCGSDIRTIIERYYIKKYDAISLGYNKINAPNKIKSKSNIYNMNTRRASIERNINIILNEMVLNIFDFQNSLPEYVMSLEKLFCILEEIFGNYNDVFCFNLYRVLKRLDLSVFLKDDITNKFYEISGNQFFECRCMYCEMKTDKEISKDIKSRLERTLIKEDNAYVECPQYIGNFYYGIEIQENIDIQKIDEFRKNNKIVDATYKQQYHKTEYDDYYYLYAW